jgi:hypothetical protein
MSKNTTFYKIGDWRKVKLITNSLRKIFVNAQTLSLKRFGLKLEDIATGHINKQDLNWAPLNPAYLASKIRRGDSEQILVATSSYFQSITSYVKADSVFAGVKKGKRGENGLIEDYAKLLEYGSEAMSLPERPLWRPSFTEVMLWHVKNNMPEIYVMQKLKAMQKI